MLGCCYAVLPGCVGISRQYYLNYPSLQETIFTWQKENSHYFNSQIVIIFHDKYSRVRTFSIELYKLLIYILIRNSHTSLIFYSVFLKVKCAISSAPNGIAKIMMIQYFLTKNDTHHLYWTGVSHNQQFPHECQPVQAQRGHSVGHGRCF